MTDCVCFETIDNEHSEMCVCTEFVHMVQCDQAPGAHLVLTPHSVPPASSHISRGNHNCGWFKKKSFKAYSTLFLKNKRLPLIEYSTL